MDLGYLNSIFTSNPIYFLGFGCFIGSQAKNISKKSNLLVKFILWLSLSVLLTYKSYSHVSKLPNRMKSFHMGDEYNSLKFKLGYKALLLKVHPDTSGYDSAEEFGEALKFYEAFQNKVQPEKLWEIYVMFGDDFNIHNHEDIKKQKNGYYFTIHCFFEFLLKNLMIFIVSYYFFQGSAERGFFCKIILAIASIIYFCVQVIILTNVGFEIGEDTHETVFASLLRKWLNLPFSTNQELMILAELWFCCLIISVYTFSILAFPPTKEIMFEKMMDLARGYTAAENRYKDFNNFLAQEKVESTK
jgi:hypothetical protein